MVRDNGTTLAALTKEGRRVFEDFIKLEQAF